MTSEFTFMASVIVVAFMLIAIGFLQSFINSWITGEVGYPPVIMNVGMVLIILDGLAFGCFALKHILEKGLP